MEQFYNYRDMSPEQRESALKSLASIGFFPAYGGVKTMQRAMDKSIGEKMPQFYFVFRDTKLIGYMFLIGDSKLFRAFPWIAIDNLDELPMRVVEPLIDIAVKAWNSEGGSLIGSDGTVTDKRLIVRSYEQRLANYKHGIGRRDEKDCR